MRVNISPIGLKSVLEIKNNNKIHYSTNPNLNLNSDVFEKSSMPSFKGNMSYAEKRELERKFKNSIFYGNDKELVEYYEQNPEVIEQALWEPQELKMFEEGNIDNIFGFDEAGEAFNIYDTRPSKYIPFINKTLLSGFRGGEKLSPLLITIAQKNPDFFRKEYVLSMYANGECSEAISTLAKKDSEKVFSALESTYRKHLAIENLKITPQRQKVFETLFEIDPLRTSYIVSTLPAQRRSEFKFDESAGNADVKAVIDVINSKGDMLEANEQLLDLYDKSPETVLKAFLSPNKKTGELYINSMMKDKNRNYHGIMLYLLLKDPDKFFELAEKSDFMWNAANNKKQPYLELFEQALFVNPEKTKDILTKPSENRLIYPRTTPAMECVDNDSFDYTELFKAFYQEDIKSAFQLFNSDADWETPNLLTYYVNKKGYKAEDFISYLTNQNLRFAKALLSSETLTKVKDLRYKTAMKNLNRAKTELENEFGRKLSETEKRVMERISGVEEEMRREIKAVNGRVDGLSGYVAGLADQVHEHLFPPSRRTGEVITPSGYYEYYYGRPSSSIKEKYDPVMMWHFTPTAPYDDDSGVI